MGARASVWLHRPARTHGCLWKFTSGCLSTCACVCVCPWPCCYFAWWLNSKAVAEHRAVLGCHFLSFAGQRDSWAEGSIWAVRRWRESWCWVTDSGIEWLCPVRTPVVFMGSLALKWYIEGGRRMLHIYRIYSRTNNSTHIIMRKTHEQMPILECIYINGLAYMQRLRQPGMCGWMYVKK